MFIYIESREWYEICCVLSLQMQDWKYQNREKFIKAGLGFDYLEFEHPIYDQGMQKFVPCRSILDVLYNQGIDGARRLLYLK